MAKQLSPEQQRILRLISEGFEMRRSGNFNGKPSFYNAAYQSVRSLEKHGFIEFEGFPSVAHLTDAGRAAIGSAETHVQPTDATTADSAAVEADAEVVVLSQATIDRLRAYDLAAEPQPTVKPVCACCVTNDATTDDGLCDNCAAFVGGLQTAHQREVERLHRANNDAQVEYNGLESRSFHRIGMLKAENKRLRTSLREMLAIVRLAMTYAPGELAEFNERMWEQINVAEDAMKGQETNESGRETI